MPIPYLRTNPPLIHPSAGRRQARQSVTNANPERLSSKNFAKVLAAAVAPPAGGAFGSGITNANPGGLSSKSFSEVLVNAANFLLSLVAILALVALIWGAIMFITSIGSEDRVKTAKRIIFWAIAGVIFAGLSFVILTEVKKLLI